MKNKIINSFKVGRFGALTVLIVTVIICCLTLTACDPSSYYFEKEDLSGVVSIELINYINPEQKHFKSWVPDHSSELKSFDYSKSSVLETLDVNRKAQFIDTLCESNILWKYYTYDSPNGICMKLSYDNGDFLIINSKEPFNTSYIGKFTSDGEVAAYIGSFSTKSFKTLVNDYFQTQI